MLPIQIVKLRSAPSLKLLVIIWFFDDPISHLMVVLFNNLSPLGLRFVVTLILDHHTLEKALRLVANTVYWMPVKVLRSFTS
jgi:hypothetical protein